MDDVCCPICGMQVPLLKYDDHVDQDHTKVDLDNHPEHIAEVHTLRVRSRQAMHYQALADGSSEAYDQPSDQAVEAFLISSGVVEGQIQLLHKKAKEIGANDLAELVRKAIFDYLMADASIPRSRPDDSFSRTWIDSFADETTRLLPFGQVNGIPAIEYRR